MNIHAKLALLALLTTGATVLVACSRSGSAGQIAGATSAQNQAEADSSFPLTIQHVFGKTTINSKPERVVSLSFGRGDTLLALGIEPVAVRYWYKDYPYATWPWAQDLLGNAQPEVLQGELDFEKIAQLEPDLILALWSGIKEEDYRILSKIAPVVAHPAEYESYSTPWDVQTSIVGRAVGKSAEAQQAVDRINGKIASIAEAHPQWEGQTAVIGFYWKDAPGAYTNADIRVQLINQLGFVTPPAIEDAAGDSGFTASFSREDLSPMDANVLFWIISNQQSLENIKSLKLRKTLQAHREGREVLIDELLGGAFSHANIVSLDYALDTIVPLIEAAVDGDPSTLVSSSEQGGLLD